MRFGFDQSNPGPNVTPGNFNRNRNRYFAENFLRRGLPTIGVGRTYLVTGEALFVWTAANARQIRDAA